MTDHRQLVENMLKQFGFSQVELDVSDDEQLTKVSITLPQEDSGVLIGYHGEKIDSLQLILGLMFNQNNVAYKPVEVDINGYRQRRKESLEELADKAVTKAVESGREILLPPLSNAERRVIHMYLSENDQVTTYSEGEGSGRRLVVRPQVGGES